MKETLSASLDSAVALHAAERNLQTRKLQTYLSHRQRTMRLLSLAAQDCSDADVASLSVLGAGNCLDLDLRELSKHFSRINLLDLDFAAVKYGLDAQLPQGDPESASLRNSVRLIAPFDLATPLASLTSAQLADSDSIAGICDALAAPFDVAPAEPAHVVVSTCLLSQIIDGLALLSSHDHPPFVSLLQALRRGHFRRMLQMLKPGGQGIFISDLVSSETTPVLQEILDSNLPQLLAQCLTSGNFFSGLNPGIVMQELQSGIELRDECCDVRIEAPWRWQMGLRVYAVYAVTFRRRQGA